jgi:hypothetical protein
VGVLVETVFSTVVCTKGLYGEQLEQEFGWKGAEIRRGPEHGSRGIAIVGAITRQILVKTLWAGKDLACALVI